jgi:hypothetical protein
MCSTSGTTCRKEAGLGGRLQRTALPHESIQNTLKGIHFFAK